MKELLLIISIVFSGICSGQNGCTDSEACNFDSTAVTDDGTCLLEGQTCLPDGIPDTDLVYVGTTNCECVGHFRGDFDNNNLITVLDLARMLAVFGMIDRPVGDFNNTGDVTAADLTGFLSMFGANTP